MTRSATLIVNTKARRGQECYTQAQECLRAGGVTVEAAHALDDPARLPEVIQDSLARGAKLLVVGGGDGSFRTVAGLLAHTDAVLGLLPLGTVNDFARNLGIDVDMQAACQVITEGRVARIALGQANDHYFVITASLGFSAQSQLALTPRLKKAFGPYGYVVAGLLALRSLRVLAVTFQSEQGAERLEVVQAGVIHGHYWLGGKVEIPGVDLESGRLAFYAVPPHSGGEFLRLARRLMRQSLFHTPGLRAFTTSEITLHTETPQPLVIDGDLCGQSPVRLRVVPEALQVCVPATFERY